MRAERAGYSVREQLPLPTAPPYTAHLANLSFDANDDDVNEFFQGCDVKEVRIVKDRMDDKPKGFGYVTFDTLEGLKKALDLSNSPLAGRAVRVSVAEPRMSLDHRSGYTANSTQQKVIAQTPHATSAIGLAKARCQTFPISAESPTDQLTTDLTTGGQMRVASEVAGEDSNQPAMARSGISPTGNARAHFLQRLVKVHLCVMAVVNKARMAPSSAAILLRGAKAPAEVRPDRRMVLAHLDASTTDPRSHLVRLSWTTNGERA